MSVFRAANNSTTTEPKRESYPINRAPEEQPFLDGPTERIDKDQRSKDQRSRPPKRRSNGGVFFAVLVAVVALTLAVIAGVVAWRALRVARVAADSMAQHGDAAPVTPAASATPETTAGYSVAYAQEPLRVQVGCSAVMYLDLDEPRADADEQVSDLRYDSRCGKDAPRLTLAPGAAAGAQIQNTDTDAADCERAIRTSPLGPGATVDVKEGTVLCVLTAATPAEMALVEITDVGQTGTAGMRATSWKIAG
jgi:hypothetical protein